MVMPTAVMVVRVPVATIRPALRLEGRPHHHEIRSEATEHVLDHMVRPDAKDLVLNLGRHMSISQMPGKPHQLAGISMPDFNDKLRCRLNLQPSAIVKLQTVAIGHCNRFWKIDQDIFALICGEANAAPVARVEVESESARRLFCWPLSQRVMN
jgi:hypothetical protein